MVPVNVAKVYRCGTPGGMLRIKGYTAWGGKNEMRKKKIKEINNAWWPPPVLSPSGIDTHSQDGWGISESQQPAQLFDVSGARTRKRKHNAFLKTYIGFLYFWHVSGLHNKRSVRRGVRCVCVCVEEGCGGGGCLTNSPLILHYWFCYFLLPQR